MTNKSKPAIVCFDLGRDVWYRSNWKALLQNKHTVRRKRTTTRKCNNTPVLTTHTSNTSSEQITEGTQPKRNSSRTDADVGVWSVKGTMSMECEGHNEWSCVFVVHKRAEKSEGLQNDVPKTIKKGNMRRRTQRTDRQFVEKKMGYRNQHDHQACMPVTDADIWNGTPVVSPFRQALVWSGS